MNNKTRSKKWDLEERTAKFGENIIIFSKKSPKESNYRSINNSIG